MRRFLLSAVLAALPIAVAAATLAPSVIVANPSMYDGKSVTVSGTVSNFKTKDTAIGNFTRFSLCDTQCITVVDKTMASHAANSTATISGTFHASYQGPKKTWTNVLTVGF
jgi:hypothetical protein